MAKKIFLSYSWKNKRVADLIYNDLKHLNVSIIVDEIHGKYKTSLKDFMHKIAEVDHVLMIISDSFLKSYNCMYEMIELLNTHDLTQRILPVISGNPKIFNTSDRTSYYDYWQDEIDLNQNQIIKYATGDFVEKKRRAQKILLDLPEFFEKISDLFIEDYETLRLKGYKPLLDILKVDNSDIIAKTYRIVFFDEGGNDKLIKELQEQYPDHPLALETFGLLAMNEGNFDLSRQYFERALEIDPKSVTASNNYAYILHKFFDQTDSVVEEMYLYSLKMDPDSLATLRNYSDFLLEKSHYRTALTYLEKIVDLEPIDGSSHLTLGYIYSRVTNDYGKARIHYEAAILNSIESAEMYCDYAEILYKQFDEKDQADKYFQKSIEIDNDQPEIFYAYACFLEDAYEDLAGAKKNYEKAIELEPENDMIYTNFGTFLMNTKLGTVEEATFHFNEALKINPKNPAANFQIAQILKLYVNRDDLATTYYRNAIEVDPSLRNSDFEQSIGFQL